MSDENTKIVERSLPIENNIMGLNAIPVGGPQGFLEMKEVGYRLAVLGFTVLAITTYARTSASRRPPRQRLRTARYCCDGFDGCMRRGTARGTFRGCDLVVREELLSR
jgi:hypothetical protein